MLLFEFSYTFSTLASQEVSLLKHSKQDIKTDKHTRQELQPELPLAVKEFLTINEQTSENEIPWKTNKPFVAQTVVEERNYPNTHSVKAESPTYLQQEVC